MNQNGFKTTPITGQERENVRESRKGLRVYVLWAESAMTQLTYSFERLNTG